MILATAFCFGGLLYFIGAANTGAGHGPPWAFTALVVGYWIALVSGAGLVLFGICFVGVILMSKSRPNWQKGLAIGITALVLILVYRPVINNQAYNATFKGEVGKYRLARKLGAKCNLNDDLWLAARWGHYELVNFLISEGADVNARLGSNGDTVLFAAIDNLGERSDGNFQVIKLLLNHGANPANATSSNETAIERATRTSKPQLIVDLLSSYSKASKK